MKPVLLLSMALEDIASTHGSMTKINGTGYNVALVQNYLKKREFTPE